ncbi:MAG: isochorismatase family cysteine hydrolase [Bifidobacteriaceae bacterium]|nr:isochorismatase family cysteine hydrolase [Bifidobacteriaceae bacterium]
MNSNSALISIDYTYDFVASDGLLTTGQAGQAIEKDIAQFTQECIESGMYTVFAIDGHDSNDKYHPETALFPAHNIVGTSGREIYGALGEVYSAHRNDSNVYWMDKQYYSAFNGTNLDVKLRQRHITDLYLTGVCTDICVLHTAIEAYNKGYSLHIPRRAVASFNEVGHEWAMEHFQNVLGAQII